MFLVEKKPFYFLMILFSSTNYISTTLFTGLYKKAIDSVCTKYILTKIT
jgi:hypothetical protein